MGRKDIKCKFEKGTLSGRKSYKKDIMFRVERIIRGKKGNIAILKGIIHRIEADSPIEDLEVIDKWIVEENIKKLTNRLQERLQRYNKQKRTIKEYYGKILHLEGDKKYSEKSAQYYKKLGLNAIVRNIPENRQASVISELLTRHKPDIVVITGHDAMIKNGSNYNDIYNYRNSKYFINTVLEARRWEEKNKHEIAIFAGACQSFFEAIITSGANFASSPSRILIDFIDPLIVAEKIATTDEYKYLTIGEIVPELRDGLNGVGGIRK